MANQWTYRRVPDLCDGLSASHVVISFLASLALSALAVVCVTGLQFNLCGASSRVEELGSLQLFAMLPI